LNKPGYLRGALQRPEFQGRLIYGTDFPLVNMMIVSPYHFPLNLRLAQMRAIAAIRNPWDRDVALKQALGVPRTVFERPAELFKGSPQPREGNDVWRTPQPPYQPQRGGMFVASPQAHVRAPDGRNVPPDHAARLGVSRSLRPDHAGGGGGDAERTQNRGQTEYRR
jgi:hypothetical protein